jgi:acetate kinase
VDAVAHRIVHGGDVFREPVVIDDGVLARIRELRELAPLQTDPALSALDDARAALPHVPHVAVFDTAFHATLPREAYTYAVPERLGIRRFGFHGLSVQWAAEQVRVPRLVVCHLGGGCSVTAVRDGRSVDTSMGFTPLEGVPMATRSGSVDPGAIFHLLPREPDLERVLNEESGLLALGGSADVREVSEFALDVFCYRIACTVGAMAVALDGIDALVFTAGVGEHSARVRDGVTSRLGHLQPFDVHVVAAREELVAARAARTLLA